MAVSYKILILFAIVNVGWSSLIINPPKCIHDYHELWPHQDPNQYWFCDHLDDDPKALRCDEGRGFLRVEGVVSGCVPWGDWNCRTDLPKLDCKKDSSKPYPHEDPNKFWACEEGTLQEKIADCLDYPYDPTGNKHSRGFVSNDQNLGCVPWTEWACGAKKIPNRE